MLHIAFWVTAEMIYDKRIKNYTESGSGGVWLVPEKGTKVSDCVTTIKRLKERPVLHASRIYLLKEKHLV